MRGNAEPEQFGQSTIFEVRDATGASARVVEDRQSEQAAEAACRCACAMSLCEAELCWAPLPHAYPNSTIEGRFRTVQAGGAIGKRRLTEVDPLQGPKCGGTMHLIDVINHTVGIRRSLKHLRLWDPNPREPDHPARTSPELPRDTSPRAHHTESGCRHHRSRYRPLDRCKTPIRAPTTGQP